MSPKRAGQNSRCAGESSVDQTNLAKSMVKLIDSKPGNLTFVYEDSDELWIVGLA